MLLLARDEDGEPMTDGELRDELLTLLVAGHETTATGLAWAFELLLRNPRVLERLKAELASGDEAYLAAVVKEALRIRPVISGVGRVVRGDEPFEVGGHQIPPGVEINPSIAAIHRRADRYPAAAEFRPERFLGGRRARTPTRGCRSAAAPGAAWARASPRWRCGWPSGACSSARPSSRRGASPSAACAAASRSGPSTARA